MDIRMGTQHQDKPLTRTDIERLLQQAGSSDKLDLSNQNLRNIDLSDIDLSNANFVNCNLASANLSGTNFSGANLSGANLSGVMAPKANFSGTDLYEAILFEAVFPSTNFSDAFLSQSNLTGATFYDANLTGANLYASRLHRTDLSRSDLSRADLAGTFLVNANLSNANLSNANLSRVNLSNANLSNANLSHANLTGSNLSDTDLSDANLLESDLSDASLIDANLSDANLSNANLSNANLSHANLSRAFFPGTNIFGANFDSVIISEADLRKNPNLRVALFVITTSPAQTHQNDEQKTSLPLHIRILDEPLTAQNLLTLISSLTELSTKYWLIVNNRFANLIEYTQTHSSHFVEEAHTTITKISYNSPLEMKWNFDISATNLADAMIKTIDGVVQRHERLEKMKLENQAKIVEIKEAEQRLDQANQEAQLDIEKRQLDLKQQELEIVKAELEIEKTKIEYALELASKIIDTLQPELDPSTRAMAIQAMLPNFIQLSSVKGLSLVLPQEGANSKSQTQ